MAKKPSSPRIRREFILETLGREGRIRAKCIYDEFGITRICAQMDLRAFRLDYPEAVYYGHIGSSGWWFSKNG